MQFINSPTLTINTCDFTGNQQLRAVSSDFRGTCSLIKSENSHYFHFLQPFFDQLSYIYSQEDKLEPGFRIRRYREFFNEKLIRSGAGACLGRGMFVAYKLMHAQKKDEVLQLEFSTEVQKTITILSYLFDAICADAHKACIRNKIEQARSLFTQIICGMKPLEDIRLLESTSHEKIQRIGDLLKSRLNDTCQLVAIGYAFLNHDNSISERHINYFLSDSENNRHYLIDINFPIIQFNTKDDLIHSAPKLVRTFFAKTQEINQAEMLSLGFENNCYNFDQNHFKIDKILTFQKVSYQIPEFNRMKAVREYSKSIWSIPYEISSPNVEEALCKIKIQKIIYLVSHAIEFYEIFHPPFVLSPLTGKGVKAKILEHVSKNPISLSME